MKAIAINGSPRKNWNTATLLKKALDGAVSAGAEIELVHLVVAAPDIHRAARFADFKGQSAGMAAHGELRSPILRNQARVQHPAGLLHHLDGHFPAHLGEARARFLQCRRYRSGNVLRKVLVPVQK